MLIIQLLAIIYADTIMSSMRKITLLIILTVSSGGSVTPVGIA